MFSAPAKKRMHTTREQLAGMKRRLAELRLCEAHGGVGNGRFTGCEENGVSSSKRNPGSPQDQILQTLSAESSMLVFSNWTGGTPLSPRR